MLSGLAVTAGLLTLASDLSERIVKRALPARWCFDVECSARRDFDLLAPSLRLGALAGDLAKRVVEAAIRTLRRSLFGAASLLLSPP